MVTSGSDSFSLRAALAAPGLLTAYAVVAFALVPFCCWWAGVSLQAGRAVDAQRLCEVDRSGPCLQQASGVLKGPDSAGRSINDRWEVSGVDGSAFVVGPGASGRLEKWAGEAVVALTYRGDIVVVVAPDGRRTTGVEVGAGGVVNWGACTLLALVAGVGLVRQARRRLRASGGWWRSGGMPPDFFELRIAIAGLPPLVCATSMRFGASWQLGIAAGTAVALALVVAAVRSQRRASAAAPPRHARDLA